MVKSATSCGVKVARFTELVQRLIQYLQSYIQELLNNIFNKEIHRPSAPQVWQIPEAFPLPIPSFLFFRLLPLELQEASYFAESANIFNLFRVSIFNPFLIIQTFVLIITQKNKKSNIYLTFLKFHQHFFLIKLEKSKGFPFLNWDLSIKNACFLSRYR